MLVSSPNLITICELFRERVSAKLLKTRRIRIDYLDRSHRVTSAEKQIRSSLNPEGLVRGDTRQFAQPRVRC